MKKYCYFNGKIIALNKVGISPYDIGLLRGYGVFDVMCTENGKPFLLNEHWRRFQNSAKELNLKIPIAKNEYKNILQKIISLNGFPKSIIRTILTGGPSDNGFSHISGNETFLILIEKFIELPKEVYSKGSKVITLKYNRQFPLIKTTNYIAAIKHQKIKEKNKAIEIIYFQDGNFLEAATSNLFIVKDNQIITPKKNVLSGITRNLIIKLAKQKGINIEEREIPEKDFFAAAEVFLTATNKGIVPIIGVDDKVVGNGQVGEITKVLINALNDFSGQY
ncbi:MAG: aminotransferase class IV [Candidatus Azambacteria bacterium]|nr:aminotransferase class IV [Candidatus Azambacteria bacterium]